MCAYLHITYKYINARMCEADKQRDSTQTLNVDTHTNTLLITEYLVPHIFSEELNDYLKHQIPDFHSQKPYLSTNTVAIPNQLPEQVESTKQILTKQMQ